MNWHRPWQTATPAGLSRAPPQQLVECDLEVVGEVPQIGQQFRQDTMPTSSLPFSDITVMLSPDPWKIGPSGYIALTSAPRKYSGFCGPGTLEMTRLCTGRAPLSRVLA